MDGRILQMTPETEATLVEPDRGTMGELCARYVPSAIRLAYVLTGDRAQAEDLAHEAFVRCVGRFAHLRDREAFDAYLRRAIVNLHTSGLRRRRVEKEWRRREGPRVAHASAALPDGAELAWPVVPPTSGSSIEFASQPVGQATVAFGATASDVEAVEIVTGDGTAVTPTSVPWPSTLEAFASPDAPVDGTIWWATVPDVDTVSAVLADGTTDSGGLGVASGASIDAASVTPSPTPSA